MAAISIFGYLKVETKALKNSQDNRLGFQKSLSSKSSCS